ncbi:uncharacterized protein LOC112345929 [Selaginella moellendorffii]|uniref:uncharacterized protein LOC112345929 n=1 Tax=Selaginella moellendorffii TaxID=88036 RepID=UPI000D1C83F0|nr:uncharacterized protein LOC112345929 [Selaginella moellendorffii]|eukprot:XP_024529424.1 uncharacterized protein LOC112345929 [Selaginella moellendorffii]
MLLLDSIVVALAQENRLQNNRRSLTAEELEERKLTIVSNLSRFQTSSNLAPKSSSRDQMEIEESCSSDPATDHQNSLSMHSSSPEQSRSDFSPDMSLETIFSKLVTKEQEKIRKSVSQHAGKNARAPFEWDESWPGNSLARGDQSEEKEEKGFYSPHHTASSSMKNTKSFFPESEMYHHHHDHQSREDELEEASNLSPTTVFHYGRTAGSSSSESTPPAPKLKDLNSILPFPASFPSVTTPMEALLLANDRGFSFSMSQAVPDSPTEDQLHAISPLSFDTGSPCEHILPGRLDFYTYYRQHQQQQEAKKLRAKSGPQKLGSSSSLWGLTKSISFSGGPRHSSSDIFLLPRRSNTSQAPHIRNNSSTVLSNSTAHHNVNPTSSESKESSSRSSSKNSNTTVTSSEFSIELAGSRPSGIDASALNSSRYLDLDFTKNTVDVEQQSQEFFAATYKDKHSMLYDVKSEIRSRVEEVVRNTDESKFTFSPVNSSFLFPKSTSRDTSTTTGLYSGNFNLDGLIDFQPGEEKSSGVEDTARTRSVIERMYGTGSPRAGETSSESKWSDSFLWICCCTRRRSTS